MTHSRKAAIDEIDHRQCSHCQHVKSELKRRIQDKTLFRMAKNIVSCSAHAQDLVQMTATRVLSRPHSYQRGNFDGFAKVVMTRLFLNQRRSQKYECASTSDIEVKTWMSTQQVTDSTDDRLFLKDVYQSLSVEDRELFLLLGEGYKHFEIAEILKINQNTCSGRIRRMIIKIRKTFNIET